MRLIQFILILFSTLNIYAQKTEITYHKKDGSLTKDINQAYYEKQIIIPKAKLDLVQVKETFTKSGLIKSQGFYASQSKKIFVDQKVSNYENGILKSDELYSNDGVLIDSAYYYHQNGTLKSILYYPYKSTIEGTKVTDTLILTFQDSLGNILLTNGNGYAEIGDDYETEKGHLINHEKHGQWEGTFFYNKYSFKENYENGNLISGITTDSLGIEYPYNNSNYHVEPECPGGIHAFRQSLAKDFHFPKEALKNNVQGTLYAQFTINKEGNIEDININSNLGYGLDSSFRSALKTSKKWKPGIYRGVPVRVAYSIPLRIDLREN